MALHFTRDEFAARRKRACARMAKAGLDGLLIFRQERIGQDVLRPQRQIEFGVLRGLPAAALPASPPLSRHGHPPTSYSHQAC